MSWDDGSSLRFRNVGEKRDVRDHVIPAADGRKNLRRKLRVAIHHHSRLRAAQVLQLVGTRPRFDRRSNKDDNDI